MAGALLVGAPAWAESSLDALIEEANAARTADPRKVDTLLARIDGMLARATPEQLGKIRMLRVHRSITTGNSSAAIAELKQILEGAGDSSTRFLAASMLANTYAVQRQFEESLRALDIMLGLTEQLHDRELRHRGLMVAAVVYNQVGEYALAMRHADSVSQDQPTTRNACAIASVTLEAYNGLGRSFADSLAQDALKQCDAEPIFGAFLRWHWAQQMELQKRTGEAVALLKGHLATTEATGYPYIIAQYHASIADLSLRNGDAASARIHAAKALAISSEAMSAEAIVKAYHVQYLLAQQAGDSETALTAYRHYAEAERAHFSDMKSREMAFQVVRHQSLQQAQQIELLHQKNQLLQLQQSVTEQRARSWLLLVLVLVGLVATIGIWAYKTKRMQLRFKRMTETDALTGIFNRQHFADRATAALLQCERDGAPAALVMFDLDHFKQVNDRYGHAAGDWALRRVADAVRPLCRDLDAFGRLGGEEFALILPGLDAKAAVRLAGDAQARLAAIDTAAAGYGFRLAASFGVAEGGEGGYALASLLSRADQAMYAAKHGGRRQVRVYEPGTVGPQAVEETAGLLRDIARGATSSEKPGAVV